MILLKTLQVSVCRYGLGKPTPSGTGLRQGRRVPTAVGARREGLLMGRGWSQADSFRLAGEGAALSRFQWAAAGGMV